MTSSSILIRILVDESLGLSTNRGVECSGTVEGKHLGRPKERSESCSSHQAELSSGSLFVLELLDSSIGLVN